MLFFQNYKAYFLFSWRFCLLSTLWHIVKTFQRILHKIILSIFRFEKVHMMQTKDITKACSCFNTSKTDKCLLSIDIMTQDIRNSSYIVFFQKYMASILFGRIELETWYRNLCNVSYIRYNWVFFVVQKYTSCKLDSKILLIIKYKGYCKSFLLLS